MMQSNTQIATLTQQLADEYALQSILAEIQLNLTFLQQGTSGQLVTVNGANLFQLAAQYYGDATLWTAIAQANNLVDPEVPAGTAVTLTIPSSPVNYGGILQL
jgi:nucleoid-associated protein YgaU